VSASRIPVKSESEGNEGRENFSSSGRGGLSSFGKVVASFGDAHDSRSRRLRLVVGTLAIAALVFAVYRPILPGVFLMDDARLIGADNPLVNGALTPWTIWFQTDFTLATFGWWVEGLVFGKNPAGYHVVSMALQAISGVLLWRLLALLKIPGAWLAAAVFVIHPVCVNSVARVAELKNTLSLPFYLFSFFGYLHYETLALYPETGESVGNQRLRNRATLWYGVSLVAYVLALLAKTTAVMLPVVFLICAAWQRNRVTRRDVLHTAPYFVVALAFGLMTVWFQRHQALVTAGQMLQPASFEERLAGAGQDFWFYLGKALLPVNLSVVYYRWRIDAGALSSYLPGVLACVVFILCWRFRRTWGRHALFGLGCYAVTLLPVLGFFDAQFLTMWRVSDHLQYKPMIAIVALAVAGLAILLRNKTAFRCAAAGLLLTLSVLAFNRAQVFATEEGLLRDTLAKNPAAWAAHNDLGVILAKRGDYADAMSHFSTSLEFNPNNVDAHLNLAHSLALQGKFGEAEAHLLAALKIKPDDPALHREFARVLEAQGENQKALQHLQTALIFNPEIETREELASLLYQTGDSRQSAMQFRRVLLLKPDQLDALNNLAWLLATCPDDAVRNGGEAVQHAEHACRLTAFKQARETGILAAAYAEAGRFQEAIATGELSVRLASAAGDNRSAAVNRQLLVFYRAGKPWHEPPFSAGGQ
jgi:Flp pilus assembly protein TadD